MDFSVIIPTYNRGARILGTLDSLRHQSVQPSQFEVVVVDDGSTDDTFAQVSGFLEANELSTWRCLRLKENRGKTAALNTGSLAASGTILAFTDDDIIPCEKWVAAHQGQHESAGQSIGVVGPVKYPDEWIQQSNLVHYHNSTYLGQPGNRMTRLILAGKPLPPSHWAGGNSSLPRQVLLEVGLFDETLRRAVDGELAIRLVRYGLELCYEPQALVTHRPDYAMSYQQWITQFGKNYQGGVEVVTARYPEESARYGHWFLGTPSWGKEPLGRSIAKTLCRLSAQPAFGRLVFKLLERLDKNPKFYHPMAYKYVLACVALRAMKTRRDKGAGKSVGQS